MPPKKERIIFDANFFICMLQIKARNILGNLNKAAEDLGYEYYISQVVFDEIKAPHTYKDKLKSFVNVVNVLPNQVDAIRDKLRQFNVRFPAQDPDLTLVCIGNSLLNENKAIPVHLVTDDFKLAKNTNLLYKSKINIFSLSIILLLFIESIIFNYKHYDRYIERIIKRKNK